MFKDMLDAIEESRKPMEDFYDGYVVNAIVDACYKSVLTKQWEPIKLVEWRGSLAGEKKIKPNEYDDEHWLIKEEKMPDGQTKVILKDKATGLISQVIKE